MRHDIFSTPVWHIEGASLELVDELYKMVPTIKENEHLFNLDKTLKSNQEGYQTSQFDWQEFHPEGKKYIEKLVTDIFSNHYVVSISGWWYNINLKGSWNTPHSHPGVDFALVWYLTDSHGLLQLMNPNSSIVDSRDGSFDTKKGDILIFPGDIIHYVMPHTKETDRVCISMNLRLLQLC